MAERTTIQDLIDMMKANKHDAEADVCPACGGKPHEVLTIGKLRELMDVVIAEKGDKLPVIVNGQPTLNVATVVAVTHDNERVEVFGLSNAGFSYDDAPGGIAHGRH